MKTLSNKQLTELEPIIVQELTKAKGKDCIKQVANKLKIEQDVVRHIYNTRKVGQLKQKTAIIITSPIKKKPYDSSSIVDDTSLLPDQELQSKMSESTNNKESDKSIKERKERVIITDDIKIAVAMDIETGEYTYFDLAEKYNISYASVARIKKEMIGGKDLRGSNKKSDKRAHSTSPKTMNKHYKRKSIQELRAEYVKPVEDVVEEDISVVEETSLVEREKNVIENSVIETILSTSYEITQITEKAVKAGLCSDRHEMGVEKFIYNILNGDEMFNYSMLYNKAMAFIADNCPDKILHLYVTGIQCALAAVIKACHDSECTLSLFHYNAATSTYMRQDMWKFTNEYVDELTASYSDLLRRGPVYTFNVDNISAEEFYTISISELKNGSDNFVNQSFVICASMEDAFKLYADYVKYIQSNDGLLVKKCCFLTKCKVEKGKFIWEANISKSYNYK